MKDIIISSTLTSESGQGVSPIIIINSLGWPKHFLYRLIGTPSNKSM